jgi:hypothetical protein
LFYADKFDKSAAPPFATWPQFIDHSTFDKILGSEQIERIGEEGA